MLYTVVLWPGVSVGWYFNVVFSLSFTLLHLKIVFFSRSSIDHSSCVCWCRIHGLS